MNRAVIVFVVLATATYQGSALKCPTCSGSKCSELVIPEIECNRRIPNLHLNDFEIVNDDTEYGCLDLEYQSEDNALTKVKQCVLLENGRDYCEVLSTVTTLDVKKCEVASYTLNLEMAKQYNIVNNGSNTTVTSEKPTSKTTVTDKATSSTSVKPSASSVKPPEPSTKPSTASTTAKKPSSTKSTNPASQSSSGSTASEKSSSHPTSPTKPSTHPTATSKPNGAVSIPKLSFITVMIVLSINIFQKF